MAKKAVKKAADSICEVIVETVSGIHRGQGATIEEAFMNIPVEYTQIKHKGTIKLRKDEATFEKFFPVMALKRMFTTKIAKQHWANMLSKFLR